MKKERCRVPRNVKLLQAAAPSNTARHPPTRGSAAAQQPRGLFLVALTRCSSPSRVTWLGAGSRAQQAGKRHGLRRTRPKSTLPFHQFCSYYYLQTGFLQHSKTPGSHALRRRLFRVSCSPPLFFAPSIYLSSGWHTTSPANQNQAVRFQIQSPKTDHATTLAFLWLLSRRQPAVSLALAVRGASGQNGSRR